MWVYTLDPKPPWMKQLEILSSKEANGGGITMKGRASFPTLSVLEQEKPKPMCAYRQIRFPLCTSLLFVSILGECERRRGGNISGSVSRRWPLGGRSYQKSQQKPLLLPLSGAPLSGITPLMVSIEEEEDGTESPHCSVSGSGWLPCGVSSTRHQALPEHPTLPLIYPCLLHTPP